MAETDFGALTEAQKRVWSAQLWQAGRDQSFWFSNGFVGRSDSDMNRPVQRITKLTETERGRECVMQLVQDLQNDGVVGDNKLEDNEEALLNDTQVIRIDQLRNGVRSKGAMSEQATVIRFRAVGKEKLAFWIADKLDELMFLVATGRAFTLKVDGSTRGASQLPQLTFAPDVVAASTNRIRHAGSATSEATITAADTVDWNFIVGAKQFAKRKRIKPIRERGKEFYAILLTTEQERDLMQDTVYQTLVSRGQERGINNPLFKNALAVVQGCIIHSHAKTYNTLGLASGSKWGSGGTVEGAQALLLGSQAVGLATLGSVFMRERDDTDYDNRPGLGVGRKIGMLKPQFRSIYDNDNIEDFAVMSLKTAAAA